MSQSTTKRPPQVTLAGTVIVAASLLVVLAVWERLATLRSLESREGVERFLGSPLGEGLGLDVEGALELLHVAALVTAGCATATAILGWFVLRRDTTSRVAVSVLAVPLFLSAMFLGDFFASFVAAAAAMLWLSPAREWFATGSWTPPQPRERPASDARRPTDPWPPVPPPHAAAYGSTIAPTQPHAQTTAQDHPWGPVHRERPRSVVTAAVLAIVMSVLVGALAVLVLVVVWMAPELLQTEMERQQAELGSSAIDVDQLRPLLLGVALLYLALCALAVVLAGFVLAGREWARRGLVMTAGISAGICFLAAFSAPSTLVALPALLPAVAAMTTLALLRRPESQEWCRAGDAARRG